MTVDVAKLKSLDRADLVKEINRIDDRIANDMYPVSWARCSELLEYKSILIEELKNR